MRNPQVLCCFHKHGYFSNKKRMSLLYSFTFVDNNISNHIIFEERYFGLMTLENTRGKNALHPSKNNIGLHF